MAIELTPPKTEVTVRLTGCRDAFEILARVEKSLKHAGHEDLAREYLIEATAADFNHLMRTTLQYVQIKNDRPGRHRFIGKNTQAGLVKQLNCNTR